MLILLSVSLYFCPASVAESAPCLSFLSFDFSQKGKMKPKGLRPYLILHLTLYQFYFSIVIYDLLILNNYFMKYVVTIFLLLYKFDHDFILTRILVSTCHNRIFTKSDQG
uniref:Uncharacterized protein n=1 Tax=Cacopsylla melanoneura TaxID=428564 RepID=A0A8D8UUU4_9HEMI